METLLLLALFLVVLLAVLIILFFSRKNKKKAVENLNQEKRVNGEAKIDFTTLVNTIKDENTSAKQLQATLDAILEDYAEIKDFSLYQDILLQITHHPHTNKNIILNFDRGLSEKNPSYKKEISNAVTKGLDSRK